MLYLLEERFIYIIRRIHELMNYIVFDLEFNQDIPNNDIKQNEDTKIEIRISEVAKNETIISEDKNTKDSSNGRYLPFEILQIGAIKMDSALITLNTFNQLVKPSIYTKVNSYITELTGITTKEVLEKEPFPKVYNDFLDFIEDKNSVFCVWGVADVKELYRSARYYSLDTSKLPNHYINLQPYASQYFGLSKNKLLQLKHTIEGLNIPITYEFHNALHDAYYTAEIMKKIYNTTMKIEDYDPDFVKTKQNPPKQVIDIPSLLGQFEKMYQRKLTKEEEEIVVLAYKMGKTKQFLK